VYNTTRQVGGVLGSAAIATVIVNRLSANLPGFGDGAQGESATFVLPDVAKDGFTTAMSQTLVVPAIVLFLGALVALWFVKPSHLEAPDAVETSAEEEPVAAA
jgi:hypothetical protein